ncbi:MAG: hypothetical protein NVSMB9_35550 [Isosphaeraceae bacterium]
MSTERTSARAPLQGVSFAGEKAQAWQPLLAAELRQLALCRPWGRAVMAVGWVHLVSFLVCQGVYTAGSRVAWVSLLLWSLEVLAVLGVLRQVAGRGWAHGSAAIGLIVRIWVTFLILSFNVAMLNTLTGWSIDWFKPVWCTLSSFGFATMAWLFGARFLIQAFQMYFTGLLVVRFPQWGYLIHGVSWWGALQVIGWDLARHRARLLLETRLTDNPSRVVDETEGDTATAAA